MNNNQIISSRIAAAAKDLAERYYGQGPLPHLHLHVSVRGEPLLEQCYGYARDGGTVLEKDAIYRIASMTKPVIVAAFMTLVEEGAASFDMRLADIFPAFAEMQLWSGSCDATGALESLPCDTPITLYDLVRHSAGLTYSFNAATPIDRLYAEQALDSFHQRRDAEGYAAALAALPLVYRPGTRFHYSVAIDLLGAVIERLSGMGLDQFLDRRIFAPLGMEDSFFVIPPEKEHRLADAWMWDGKGDPQLYDRGAQSRWRISQKFYSAGGGLLSTVQDYHRFLGMVMAGGTWNDVRILKPESIALMRHNHLPGGGDLERESSVCLSETSLPGIGMGLGGAVMIDPAKASAPASIGTYFWGGILSTGFFMDPKHEIIGLVMTQLMPSGMTNLREDFRRMVYGAVHDQ